MQQDERRYLRLDRLPDNMIPHAERNGIYQVATVLDKVPAGACARKGDVVEDFDGDMIDMGSFRYLVFKTHGVVCSKCGLEGTFFAKERHPSDHGAMPDKWHFNLYGMKDGKEVLLVKGRTAPKVKGAVDIVKDFQTLCFGCEQKGSREKHDA